MIWAWVLAAEWAGLGIWYLVIQARERALMRLVAQVWTRHPMSTAMPTVTELHAPERIELP